MALSPRLDLRQTQSLVMTPQLQQAIKLLQLSNVELAEYVETEDIARKLTQIGIATGQGFYLSPPRTWETLFEREPPV